MSVDSNSFTITETGLPAWVPSPGNWADVGLNTLQDAAASEIAAGAPNGGSAWTSSNGYYNVWSSAIYAPLLGALGSLVVSADGGHASYNGNDVYQYDIEARTWSLFKASTRGVSGSHTDSFGEMPDGTPMPPHIYDTVEWVAHGVDGGAFGSLIQGQTYNNFVLANMQSAASHGLDLQTKNWVRLTPSINQPGSFGNKFALVRDPNTDILYAHGQGGTIAPARVSSDWSTIPPELLSTGGVNAPIEVVSGFDPTRNILMFLSMRSTADDYYWWDLDNLGAGPTTATAGLASANTSSLQYIPETDNWLALKSTDRTIWNLPAGTLGGTFTQESDSGTRPPLPVNGVFHKYRYCSSVKCLMGTSLKNGSTFAYRPLGT